MALAPLLPVLEAPLRPGAGGERRRSRRAFGDEPMQLTATVAYRTPAGERRKHTITHDLSIYRDLAYVPEGEPDA